MWEASDRRPFQYFVGFGFKGLGFRGLGFRVSGLRL